MSLIHTRLPRGGRVGRVLPAADAVAAKAEGVAHKPHRNQTKRLALRPNLRAKRVRAHCVEHYPSGDAGASTAAERRFPSADKIPRFHGFRSTRLPRDGRVGRVLSAADAVAAKAEGVAIGRTTPKPTRIPMRPNLQAYPQKNPTAAAQRKKLLFPQAAAVSFAFFSFTIHTPAG